MPKIIQIMQSERGVTGLGDDGAVYHVGADTGEWVEWVKPLPTEAKKRGSKFKPPENSEVYQLMLSKGVSPLDAQKQSFMFMDHYSSNGWKVGRNPMKDWSRAVSSWLTRWREQNEKRQQPNRSAVERVAAANRLNTDLTPVEQPGYIQPLGFDDKALRS